MPDKKQTPLKVIKVIIFYIIVAIVVVALFKHFSVDFQNR